jgi:hypothetical protein
MIVLNTLIEQEIFIIPNMYNDNINLSIDFIDETTKIVYNVSPFLISSNKDILQIVFNNLTFLKNDTFYNLSVFNTNMQNKIIYKDRVFCTTQNINNFSINDGAYTFPNIDDNAYITI